MEVTFTTPVIISVIGRPGSGKGTQGGLLSAQLNVPHVSVGALLRERGAGAGGRRIRDAQRRGDLVGVAEGYSALEERFARADLRDGFVLDGAPRTSGAVSAIDAMLAPRAITAVILLDVSEPVCRARIRVRVDRTRSDDHDARLLARRYAIFDAEIEPIAAAYGARGILHRVDGDRSSEAVYAGIRDALAATGDPRLAVSAEA